MNCYNGATYLREALYSVLAQTYANWEIIFWDNQSTDNSAKIIKSYSDPRIKYFYAPRHTILGEARNLAIEKSRGKWIAFLDCDDLWTSDKLEKQIRIINEEAVGLGIVYTKTIDFKENYGHGEPPERYREADLPEGNIFEELLLNDNFITLSSAMVHKDAYLFAGGIPLNYEHAEDYYLFVGISSAYKARCVQSVCCKYRVHDSNITLSQKTKSYREVLEIFLKWSHCLSKNVSQKQKENRIKKINTFIGAMMIKYDRKYWQGIKQIKSKGSFIILLRAVLGI
jgi:glycosyltransferase involved in cell wall biosynthesis